MKGLELSRLYYESLRPELAGRLGPVMDSAAAGLAGEGSECFGLDDGLSQDHDFGPRFLFWLPDDVLRARRAEIDAAFADLPMEFMGFRAPQASGQALFRHGPAGIRAWISAVAGLPRPPQDPLEWLAAPEEKLAAAVNGNLFEDNLGEFSSIRQKLTAYYPEDVRLKKMAARAMIMGQSGQYNLPRCLKRKDGAAAFLTLGRFAEAALSFVFLLNRKYKPYYKLAARAAAGLPLLGKKTSRLVSGFGAESIDAALCESVEEFCADCALALQEEGLSDETGSWLWPHGPALAGRIQDARIRSRNLLED